jgi:hypothetical protein
VEECNAIFGQQQMENIYNTLNMILDKDDKKDQLIKTNAQKCIAWCSKYNIAFNPFYMS